MGRHDERSTPSICYWRVARSGGGRRVEVLGPFGVRGAGLAGLGGDERAQCGVRGERPVIAMALSTRRGNQRSQAVAELQGGEGEHALPVGLGPRQGVANALVFLVPAQPLAIGFANPVPGRAKYSPLPRLFPRLKIEVRVTF